MTRAFEAVKISEHVYWVGAIDWTVRNFHGYATSHGTTYNAFLIVGGGKTVLVDTVKAPFKDELLSRISSVIEPSRIDYVLSQHTEMDHTGCFEGVMDVVRPEKIFASPNGKKALAEHFGTRHEVTALKDGEVLDLGGMKLTPLLTPMLHWPDSMVTYLDSDKVLFTQDGFGLHLASYERFTDELPDYGVWYETVKYYANILMPLSMQVNKVLDKLDELALPVEILANDHGPMWRGKGIEAVLEKYRSWAAGECRRKAVIVYDTMWKSTDLMARTIADGLSRHGVCTVVMPLGAVHRSDVATELLDAGALVVGSPTLNNGMFPTVADILCYLKGLKPRKKLAAAFGSHGWSGQGADLVLDVLREMKLEIVAEPLKCKYVPDDAVLEECRSMGARIAEGLDKKD